MTRLRKSAAEWDILHFHLIPLFTFSHYFCLSVLLVFFSHSGRLSFSTFLFFLPVVFPFSCALFKNFQSFCFLNCFHFCLLVFFSFPASDFVFTFSSDSFFLIICQLVFLLFLFFMRSLFLSFDFLTMFSPFSLSVFFYAAFVILIIAS